MGLIYDTCGSKLSSIITLIILPGSLVVLYKFIQASSISLIWFLLIAIIMGQGSSLAYTNALSTNVKNFSKRNSSNIIGLIISNSAIAPSIFASIKSSFSSMSITSYIAFVIYYVLFIMVLCMFWFDEIEEDNISIFRKKLFNDFKQRFIVDLFGYLNFLALIVFICILLFNHIFGADIPAFLVFIVLHIAFIIFIILEKQKAFDNWLNSRFNATHKGINNNYIGPNRFEIIGRSVEVLHPNEKSENKNLNNKIKQFEIKEDKDNDDNYKGYTENADISKIKDKFELKYNDKKEKNFNNKKEHSLDINLNKSLVRKSLEPNQNINNLGEYNKEANGRISMESNNEENKNKEDDKKEEEKEEDKEKKEDEDKKEDEKNNNINNKNKEIDNNNIDKEKNEDTNLEESIKNINNIDKKDGEDNQKNQNNNNNDDDNNNNKDNQNNDNEQDKNESFENGAKKINQDNDNKINNKEEEEKEEKDEKYEKEDKNEKEEKEKEEKSNENENEKKEKIEEPPLNYPRFSTNSSNNNLNHEENNIQNNYPKFSISSEKTEEENPYKEKEEENAKFSLARKSEGKKEDEENNNNLNKNRDSKLSEARYPIYDKNIINKNSFNINNDNKQEINNKNQILNQNNKNNLQSPPPVSPLNHYQNSIEETNANIINTNTSFNSLNNSSNIYSSDEKEDDNMENYSRFVFLMSLFRRKQIILLFVVLILTMGSMISNVNNIKYIVVSIDPYKEISSTSLDKYPLLYFAFNSLTRIAVGRISNELMGTDETFTILISITIMGLISQVFGFFMTKFFVYLSISFAGMTHGGIMTFVPLYCRYYFSLKNLGTVLGFLTTGNAIGSIIIATLIFPHFYHKYGVYNKNNEEVCLEKKCFRFSYGINCIFVIVAIVLAYRLYVEDKNKKIQRRKELNNKIQNTSISCYNDNNMDNSIQAF